MPSPRLMLIFRTAITAMALFGCFSFSKAYAKPANESFEPLTFNNSQSSTAVDILDKLEQRHYIDISLNDRMSERVLDSYIKRLDSNKSIFFQSDIDDFEQFRHNIDDTILNGDLTPGYYIFNRYQERLINRLESLIETLSSSIAKLDFSRKEDLLLDREQEFWPKNTVEADDIWRQRLKNSVISLRIAEKSDEEIVQLLHKRFQNQLNRVKQTHSEDAFQIYLNSLTALYDPHTTYLSPTTSENFNINMSLSLEGIGAVLQTEDEFTKVVRLVHAGPADKQGQLQPSDRIVGVAQDNGEFQDVVGLRLDEVVQLIRGPKGSVVQLQVIPVAAADDEQHTVIEITRDTVKLEEQSAKKKILEVMHEGKPAKVGIIDIPVFYIDFDAMRRGDPEYKSTTRDVKKLLAELIEEQVDGIIIDLRNNGGGSLQEANQLTGLFIESGPTVQIRHSNTRVFRDGKRSSSHYYDGPLAVLINRLSASASEIFAGAIQDYQRGIIIGTQSFGKGTVQSLTPLKQGQLKITESKFYRISGESTQHRGVIPDIEFPAMYDKDKVGESSLDNALSWDRIDPIRHRRYYDIPSIIPGLLAKHEQRKANDPDFVFLDEQLAIIEKTRDITSVPLNETERRAFQAAEKATNLAIENKRRVAKGQPPIKSFEDEETKTGKHKPGISVEVDSTTIEAGVEQDKEQEPIDPLLTETGHILMDALPIYRQSRIVVKR